MQEHEMSDEERLSTIESRADKATPGPWEWGEDRFNDRIAPTDMNGNRKPKEGWRLRDTFVYLLHGPRRTPDDGVFDPWEYRKVMYLGWWAIKGDRCDG